MKLTTVLLIATLLQVSATSLAQKITFVQKDATIKQVFDQVYKQTGYSILWPAQNLQADKKINANFHNTSLDDVLKKIFEKQALEYTIEEKTIVIKYKEPPVVNKQAEIIAKDTLLNVTGRVFNDENGLPLEGATVTTKGKTATTTDKNGSFKLTGVDPNATIVISFIGYISVEKNAAQSLGFIRLKLNNSPLNEIQVIAYGTQSKRFSVGAVSTVSAETIENQPVANVLLALQGQAPGLAITTESGAPGAKVFVQIRGQNTFTTPGGSANSKPYDQPLFIVDGVPFAKQNNNINALRTLASTNQNGGGLDQVGGLSPFNGINPSDIESVSILKDADATSIYGSEGSNGVILITTKKGHSGRTVFNTTVNTQFNASTREIKFLNTQQYLKFRNDAFASDGLIPSNNPANSALYAPDLTIFDQNKYTNWSDVIFGKGSTNTDVYSTLSGGNGSNTYLVSAGYNKSNVNYPGDYSNQRLSLHSAFHVASRDNRLGVDFTTDYSYGTNNSPGAPGNASIALPPNTPDLLNPDGSLIWFYKGINLGSQNLQFYSYLKQFSNLQNHNLQNSIRLSYNIADGLNLVANLGYNRNTTIENSANPAAARNPISTTLTTTSFSNSTAEAINIEPQLNYTKNIGKGVFTALLGGTYKKTFNYASLISGSGYTNDNLVGSINGAATATVSDINGIRKYVAGFARIAYNYDQKYIIQVTGRRDGSSNFGPGHQFGDFGSLGGGWIFSEENVVKKLVPFMSYGKLSSSYGTSGSDGVAPYLFQTFWGAGATSVPNFQGVQPSFPGNHYNPDYSWSLKKSLNAALDLGFLKDRILLNATFYRNRESNQLASTPLPVQTGFATVVENLNATIQNQGWEFSLVTKNIQSKSFSWSTNFNLSFNRNKLLSFDNLANTTYRNFYVIGQPISVQLGFRFAGVDPATGLPQFYNTNGTLTNSPTIQVPIANREVDYMGGFGNNLSYKQFRLNFFLQFSSQTSPTYLRTLYSSSRPGINQLNVPEAVFGNYWMNPGDQSKLIRITSQNSSATASSFSNYSTSDAVWGKNRYLRLKNVAFAYVLPESLAKKLFMKGGSINVTAQNLLTFTNAEVTDPESYGNYLSIPLQRIISLGANFTF